MTDETKLPLEDLEPRLRGLLPANLYAQAWLDQSPENLESVFEHLRTLWHILANYMPPQLAASPATPGRIRYSWEEGALMFTDLSGFTPLMEANARHGKEGAANLLGVLNGYFADMISIVAMSNGELLEFTGDALLAQFPANRRRTETAQAVRAGLRMQRAMEPYAHIETPGGPLALGMRVGIHVGRFLTADIGTPHRMEHILMGEDVHDSKLAEGAGRVSRVCLTMTAYEQVKDLFRFEDGDPGYKLVIDDLSDDELGTFDIGVSRRRMAGGVLFERTIDALVKEIADMLTRVESLAMFVPDPVLKVIIEAAAQREVEPTFPQPTIIFTNLMGLPESVDSATPEETEKVVDSFSKAFAQINAAVEARGGVLKKVTYHLVGSDMMIMFGVPVAHTNDPQRACEAALAIRDIIAGVKPPEVGGRELTIECQIGMTCGPVFAAEIGEPRGRREFNVLGNTVNTSARLMGKALGNRILITEDLYEQVKDSFDCDALGAMPLKGRSVRLKLYSLVGKK
nr:adenylate/guanylate cyclase domain-containing protein [Anaerolineae bacterium]